MKMLLAVLLMSALTSHSQCIKLDKTWHIGLYSNAGKHTTKWYSLGFSNDLFIKYLENDSVQITYAQYSPSIGPRSVVFVGKFTFNANTNLIMLTLKEPQGYKVFDMGKEIQSSLSMFTDFVYKKQETKFNILNIPKIQHYCFRVISHSIEDDIITKFTAIDYKGKEYNFGDLKFDFLELSKLYKQ